MLEEAAGQAGHSPVSLWGCPLPPQPLCPRRGAHQLLSAVTKAGHLGHERCRVVPTAGLAGGNFAGPSIVGGAVLPRCLHGEQG